MPGPGAEKLAALIAESRGLDRVRDAARLREIFAAAAPLVDRQAQPKKWAAFRSMYAQVSQELDPASALAAYREALTVWDRDADHDSWASCHLDVGWLLVGGNPMGTPETAEALEHLELVVADYPWVANTLALLYRYRTAGDPLENWRRQVRYFELALSQVSRDLNPAGWASLMNELALSWTAEPGSAFDLAMPKRIQYHQQALEAVAAARGQPETPAAKVWIETAIHLNEAYDFLVGGDPLENQRKAEEYARQALAACTGAVPADLRVQALLALGRALVKSDAPEPLPRLRDALSLYDQAAALIDPARQAVMAANIDRFRTASYLRLIELGEPDCVDPMVAAAESAYAGYDPRIYSSARRSVMQQGAEGLAAAGRWSAAVNCLERAVEAGEAALAHADSRQGRLERIFELRDSWALLAYCRLQCGDIPQALEALDRGKSRFWRPDAASASFESLADLVPEGGALLFPVLAAAKGAVVVVAASGPAVAWLPEFGRRELARLLMGELKGELGGWMRAYAYRNSQFSGWLDEIDSIGAVLYRQVWSPVLDTLAALRVERGAELVWFPQGGTGILPMHAAWRSDAADRRWLVEDYAVRYASSVRALLQGARQAGATAQPLLVSDPNRDLQFSSMELAWARRSLPGGDQTVLAGEAATAEAVLAGLPRASLAHFSTHAAFSLTDPFQSSLLLAGGERLTLDRLLPLLREAPPAAVVLSACETAMARVTGTVDEMLGFPGAFLENGTRTVLASLWPVEDSATAVLTGRFYREHFGEGKTPAQALRAAQNWLRTVTVAELAGLFGELKNDPGPAGAQAARVRSALRGADPEARIYAHPFFWAAFTVSGA